MKPAASEALAVCALCPNPCRRGVPASMAQQLESQTPSALALLAWYVQRGELAWSEDVAAALGALDAAEACKSLCVYGYDIPALVREVAAGAAKP